MNYIKKIFFDIKNVFNDSRRIADNLFTVIILFISITSFFHVVDYWRLTNAHPFNIITGVATELIIFGSILAIKTTRTAWLTFILGTIVQGLGNVFYSYMQIDVNGAYFMAYTELFKPIFELMYGDELEVIHYKRLLSMFNGLFYMVTPIVFLIAKIYLNKNTPDIQETEKQSTTNKTNETNPVVETNVVELEEPQNVSNENTEEIIAPIINTDDTFDVKERKTETYSDFMEAAYKQGEPETPKNVLKDLLSDLNEERVELVSSTEEQIKSHFRKTNRITG